MPKSANPSHIPCRLCGGEAGRQFGLTLLGRYQAGYYRCGKCGSLETEPPYWLEEAYRDRGPDETAEGWSNLTDLDTGAASRNVRNLALVMMVRRLTGANNLLDMGGGDGLLCRLLRDRGVNAYVSDPFAQPSYAQAFTRPNFDTPDLVTAFEVLEHMPEPARELGQLLAKGAPMVLASTEMYDGQGPDWWYLTPQTGQHVFFYNREALADFARRNGYDLHDPAGFTVLVKQGAFGRRTISVLYRLLKPGMLRWYGAWLTLRPTPGVDADFRALSRAAGRATG